MGFSQTYSSLRRRAGIPDDVWREASVTSQLNAIKGDMPAITYNSVIGDFISKYLRKEGYRMTLMNVDISPEKTEPESGLKEKTVLTVTAHYTHENHGNNKTLTRTKKVEFEAKSPGEGATTEFVRKVRDYYMRKGVDVLVADDRDKTRVRSVQ